MGGGAASRSVQPHWRALRLACLSLSLALLCLPSNPGLSLHDGLEKEGGAGLTPAHGRGYAASIRDESEQAWAAFLLKPATDWLQKGVWGVTACVETKSTMQWGN